MSPISTFKDRTVASGTLFQTFVQIKSIASLNETGTIDPSALLRLRKPFWRQYRDIFQARDCVSFEAWERY